MGRRSFARDGGTPFSNWVAQIRPGWDMQGSGATLP